jgi:hypothetical protein
MAKTAKRKPAKPALRWKRFVDKDTGWIIHEAYKGGFSFTVLFADSGEKRPCAIVESACYYSDRNGEVKLSFYEDKHKGKTATEVEWLVGLYKTRLLRDARFTMIELTATIEGFGDQA